MSDSAWKILFAFAAIFNFIAGLPLLLLPAEATEMLGLKPEATLSFAHNATLFFAQMSGALIVMFGVAYFLVARNLALREIALLGAAGKLLAVLLITIYWQAGALPDRTFALGLGDLAFALIFLWFAFGGRRAAA